MSNFPKFFQWKQLFNVLTGTERKIFLAFTLIAFISATYLAIDFYIKNTEIVPTYSGTYTEGVIGQPRFINPIYGETNDVDRTLIGLIYSGLMSYDKDGNLVADLVKSYQISENGQVYTFELKDNLYWHDGVPLTVDDVIYTIKTIQNSDYKSPLRANWLNVETQKISDKSFAFALGSPYNSFLENCAVKIIPQHIWKNVPPENFALSSYNLQPIGSGPYIFSDIEQANNGFIKNIKLAANNKYYNKKPFISTIFFNFFNTKEDLIRASSQKLIDGFSVSALDGNEALSEKKINQTWAFNEKFTDYSFSMPRYFAIFFNIQNSKTLEDTNVVKALNYAIDKQDLAQKMNDFLKTKITLVNSPILPDYYNYSQPTVHYSINLEIANNLLDKSGYKDQGNGQRAKANDKKPAFQFKSYLKQGSKGTEVTELQACLARLDESFKELMANETTGTYGKGTDEAVTAFQKKYMPNLEPTGETGTETRKKLNELCITKQENSIPLLFTLTTVNQPQLAYAANLIKDYWQKAGITINIKTVELSELKDIIKNRSYDALLYGQALGSLADLYPFWHSTQINDPGLNLSKYQNKKVDQLLKEAREALDEKLKIQKYEELQDVILSDNPAIFLYNPDYVYWVSEKVKGIDTTKIVDPAKRFSNITNWYIKTKRVWK